METIEENFIWRDEEGVEHPLPPWFGATDRALNNITLKLYRMNRLLVFLASVNVLLALVTITLVLCELWSSSP